VIDNLLRPAPREEALDFYDQWATEQRGA
jgi:hypothetical protein